MKQVTGGRAPRDTDACDGALCVWTRSVVSDGLSVVSHRFLNSGSASTHSWPADPAQSRHVRIHRRSIPAGCRCAALVLLLWESARYRMSCTAFPPPLVAARFRTMPVFAKCYIRPGLRPSPSINFRPSLLSGPPPFSPSPLCLYVARPTPVHDHASSLVYSTCGKLDVH